MMNTWSFDNYNNEREWRRQEDKKVGTNLLMEITDIVHWSREFLIEKQLNHFLTYDIRALMMREPVSFTEAFNGLTKNCFRWYPGEKEALKYVLESKWNKLKDLIAKEENSIKLYPDGMLGVYQWSIDQIRKTLKTEKRYSNFTIEWIRPDLFLVLTRTGSKQWMN